MTLDETSPATPPGEEETAPTEPAVDSEKLASPQTTGTDFKPIVEALLFVAHEPLSTSKIARAVTGLDGHRVRRIIEELRAEYEAMGRAFSLEELGGGFQMLTRPEFHSYLKVLFQQPRDVRLSSAALEALAIVAYKQPVNRAEIESIRGVDCSGVLQRLLEFRLIKIVGRSEELGRPLLYGTTREFLAHFGLKSIQDLPSVQELIQPEEPDSTDGGVTQDASAPSDSGDPQGASETALEET